MGIEYLEILCAHYGDAKCEKCIDFDRPQPTTKHYLLPCPYKVPKR